MWPFKPARDYRPVKKDEFYDEVEEEDEQDSLNLDDLEYDCSNANKVHHLPLSDISWLSTPTTATTPQRRKRRKPRRPNNVLLYSATGLALISILLIAIFYFFHPFRHNSPSTSTSRPHQSQPPISTSSSTAPPLRLSWHALSSTDRAHYISSVRCLLSLPSSLATTASTSLYTDFPFIHSRIGYYTHNSAPFLPWHRQFLHLYDLSLRQHCNYTLPGLVYWDWTLDAPSSLPSSPIFSSDPLTGFGTDGDPAGAITVGTTGRCVIDGAFSDIRPAFYDVKYAPHCLSRGFRDDAGNLGVIDGSAITAAAIENTLALHRYEAFVADMESRVHDAIPFGIGGDFETFTAPYDPIFFLHHTQLDRLWWIWQQRDRATRLFAYGGHGHRHSVEMASLQDGLAMGGLGGVEDVRVTDVMDTEAGCGDGDGDGLCYRY